jgi:hypothetical protein
MPDRLLKVLHPCSWMTKNKEQARNNAQPLETPDKAFNTALHDVKLLSCGDALESIRITGI